MRSKFTIAFVLSALVSPLFFGYYWAPLSRMMQTLGLENLIPWFSLGYGTGAFAGAVIYMKRKPNPEKWIRWTALSLCGVMVGMCATIKWPFFLQQPLLVSLQVAYGLISIMLSSSLTQFLQSHLSERDKAHQRVRALQMTLTPLAYFLSSTFSYWVLDHELPVHWWVTLASLSPLLISLMSFFWIPKAKDTTREEEKETPAANGQSVTLNRRLFCLVMLVTVPAMLPGSLNTVYIPVLLHDYTYASVIMLGNLLPLGRWIAPLIPSQYNKQMLMSCFLLSGTGLTLIAVQTGTPSPIWVFIGMLLCTTGSQLLFTTLDQIQFKRIKEKSSAVGLLQFTAAVVYLMIFGLGMTLKELGLPYQDLWGWQILLLPAAGIALHYLAPYVQSTESQTWAQCRKELFQAFVKVIRLLAQPIMKLALPYIATIVIYLSRPDSDLAP